MRWEAKVWQGKSRKEVKEQYIEEPQSETLKKKMERGRVRKVSKKGKEEKKKERKGEES